MFTIKNTRFTTPHESSYNRCKTLQMSVELFFDLVFNPQVRFTEPFTIAAVTVEDLPDDVRIRAMQYDEVYRRVKLLLYSSEWPEVPAGNEYEAIDVTMRRTDFSVVSLNTALQGVDVGKTIGGMAVAKNWSKQYDTLEYIPKYVDIDTASTSDGTKTHVFHFVKGTLMLWNGGRNHRIVVDGKVTAKYDEGVWSAMVDIDRFPLPSGVGGLDWFRHATTALTLVGGYFPSLGLRYISSKHLSYKTDGPFEVKALGLTIPSLTPTVSGAPLPSDVKPLVQEAATKPVVHCYDGSTRDRYMAVCGVPLTVCNESTWFISEVTCPECLAKVVVAAQAQAQEEGWCFVRKSDDDVKPDEVVENK